MEEDRGSKEAMPENACRTEAAPSWAPTTTHPQTVRSLFAARSAYWNEIYRHENVLGAIIRQRQLLALSWVDRLGLPPNSGALEIGCGGGWMTVALAKQGYSVEAIDAVDAMVARARLNAEEAEVGHRVSVRLGDAHAPGVPDAAFDLVVSLGVLPWLHTPEKAVREMARALRPGGFLIASADNAQSLTEWLDPLYSPILAPLRARAKTLLPARRRSPASGLRTVHSMTEFTELLLRAGLQKREGATFGFGPFTLFGYKVVPRGLGLFLNRELQRLVDRGAQRLAATGDQNLVLAQKIPTTAS